MTISLGYPAGIIKADWFTKHRSKKPAVALAFVTRADVEGDPKAWNGMMYSLKLVRDATRQRGAGIVIAVLGDSSSSSSSGDSGGAVDLELPADRVAAICHNLTLEPRLLCSVSGLVMAGGPPPSDERARQRHNGALAALGRLVHEQCVVYYTAQSQHVELKVLERGAAEQGPLPRQIAIRTAFKLAVFAEFRQDWEVAVQRYQEAYSLLLQVPVGVPLAVNVFGEVLRVAELVHLKLLMLLLHQGRTEDALAQAHRHLAWVTHQPPEPALSPALASWHWGVVARQYQLTSEVVGAKLEASPLVLIHKDLTRPFLLVAAARAAVARRHAFELLRQQRSGQPAALDGAAVRKGAFLGQFILRSAQGGSVALTSDEYLAYLEYEELRGNVPAWCVDLLSAALLVLRDSKQERLRSQLGLMLANEHMHAANLSAARKLLLQVALSYRREGWELLLVPVLVQLREVALRLRMPAEHVTYCLELAVLAAQAGRTGDMLSTPAAVGGVGASGELEAPALSLCRSLVQTLLSGVSDIKQGIMKQLTSDRAHQRTSHDGSHTDTTTSTSSNSGANMSHASHYGRSFHYTVEWLDTARPAAAAGGAEAVAAAPSATTGTTLVAPDILQKHNQADFGWWRCVAVSPAFSPAPPDTATLDVYFGLQNQLPVAIPVRGVAVRFADDQGEWTTEARCCSGGPLNASVAPFCTPSSTSRPSSTSPSPCVSDAEADDTRQSHRRSDTPDSRPQDQDRGQQQAGLASEAGGRPRGATAG